MTSDFRALCARMADELDEYRQLLLDDRSVTHRLADEARVALAEPEPEGPTRRQLLQLAAEFWPEGCEPAQAVPFARAALARWGRPAPQPADSEVAELVADLRMMASQAAETCQFTDAENLSCAADLLERLSPPQPMAVSDEIKREND